MVQGCCPAARRFSVRFLARGLSVGCLHAFPVYLPCNRVATCPGRTPPLTRRLEEIGTGTTATLTRTKQERIDGWVQDVRKGRFLDFKLSFTL